MARLSKQRIARRNTRSSLNYGLRNVIAGWRGLPNPLSAIEVSAAGAGSQCGKQGFWGKTGQNTRLFDKNRSENAIPLDFCDTIGGFYPGFLLGKAGFLRFFWKARWG
jgi:hypothetical protein